MEKKFKHKKTGEIATYKDGVLKSSGFCVELGVEPSSEFWEEVKEEYQIIKFRFKENNCKELGNVVVYNPKTNCYDWDTEIGKNMSVEGLKHFIKDPKWEIYSIKRLSDGEIFTIGDRIKYGGFIGIFTLKEIQFEIAPADKGTGKLTFIHDHGFLGKWLNLEKIKKAKQPVFTSSDGVDMFLGDECYIVASWRALKQKVFSNDYGNNKTSYINVFSTEKAAENYIKLNKPCLNYNEILELFDTSSAEYWGVINRNKFKDALTKLVKEKI